MFAISCLCRQRLGFQGLPSKHQPEKLFSKIRGRRYIQAGTVPHTLTACSSPNPPLPGADQAVAHTYMCSYPSPMRYLPQSPALQNVGRNFLFLLFRHSGVKENLPLPRSPCRSAPGLPAQPTDSSLGTLAGCKCFFLLCFTFFQKFWEEKLRAIKKQRNIWFAPLQRKAGRREWPKSNSSPKNCLGNPLPSQKPSVKLSLLARAVFTSFAMSLQISLCLAAAQVQPMLQGRG